MLKKATGLGVMLVGKGGAAGERGGPSPSSSGFLQLVGVLERGRCAGGAAVAGGVGRTGGTRGLLRRVGLLRLNPGPPTVVEPNGDDSARREYELVMQSFRGSYTRRADARGSGIACDSSGDGGLDVSGGRDAGRSVDTDSADSDEGCDQTDSDGFDDFIDDGSDGSDSAIDDSSGDDSGVDDSSGDAL